MIKIRPLVLSDSVALATLANNKKSWDNLRDQFPFPYTLENAIQYIGLKLKE